MKENRKKRPSVSQGRRYGRIMLRSAFGMLLLGCAVVLMVQHQIRQQAAGKTFDAPAALPGRHVAVVFGCDDRFQNRENLYFKYRMEAAAQLWHAGKLQCLIVSGDNRSKHYNEPKKMKAALVARGVPAEKIVCDYAGLRTLDSVVRAKTIFGLDQCLFVSQQFQNERAICIGEAHGMSVLGFNAQDVMGSAGRKTKWREFAARLNMWLDLHVLDTQPRHGGEKIALPRDDESSATDDAN